MINTELENSSMFYKKKIPLNMGNMPPTAIDSIKNNISANSITSNARHPYKS
ncbi:hypothetical protein [Palleniella muris]|uniref:hypothetical protein n=1 Tax=Palleniella muris TaxID=3038145 RepID=UPI001440F78A|nr:hypothetical protein [Palleniella muris]